MAGLARYSILVIAIIGWCCSTALLPIPQTTPATVSKPLSIVSVTAKSSTSGVVVRIRANKTLSNFHKPEIQNMSCVLRLPACALQDAPSSYSSKVAGATISVDTVKGFVRVFVKLTRNILHAEVTRDGARDLLLTVSSSTQEPEPTAHKTGSTRAWALDVIVIDAGHGGKDAGAEGVNGVFEKEITLAIAKKLKNRLALDMPNCRVVMTRHDDTFVELYKRTQIANAAKGKLFISIHCNSMPTKPHPAKGCETYIIRPGRNADASRVAARENSSIQFEANSNAYATLTEEGIITATMAQRSFVRFSEELATNIQKNVTAGTSLHNRGISQAGFYVLVGASMPNVLVETAFLSNTSDAEYISSEHGQDKFAESLSKAITKYAAAYQRSLKP